MGRALCCVITPVEWGRGLLPGTRRGARVRSLAFWQVPIPLLFPRAWLPCLSTGAGPAGGRRPVALRGRAGVGGGGFELSACACLRAALAVSPHCPGRSCSPELVGFGWYAPLPQRSEALKTRPRHPDLSKVPPHCGEWREKPQLSLYLLIGALVIELIASSLIHPALP